MRYHNRLSMKRRPHPFFGNLCCGTPIEHPIRKRSNITIEIVKLLAIIPEAGRWARKAKGRFLGFRLILVLPVAALGHLDHLEVVSPPAELARAWRRAPAAEVDARDT